MSKSKLLSQGNVRDRMPWQRTCTMDTGKWPRVSWPPPQNVPPRNISTNKSSPTGISSLQILQIISCYPWLLLLSLYCLNRPHIIKPIADRYKRSPVCETFTMSMSYAQMIENPHLKVRIVSIFLNFNSTLAWIESKWIADNKPHHRKHTFLPSLPQPSSHVFLRPNPYIHRSEIA